LNSPIVSYLIVSYVRHLNCNVSIIIAANDKIEPWASLQEIGCSVGTRWITNLLRCRSWSSSDLLLSVYQSCSCSPGRLC